MKYIVSLLLFFTVLASPLFNQSAGAEFNPLDDTCQNAVNSTDAKPICDASQNQGDPVSGQGGLIEVTANLLALAAAIIAVFVVIVAGITMMTSDGDASKISASRNAIIYTVVGLLVIIIARTVVIFILGRVAT